MLPRIWRNLPQTRHNPLSPGKLAAVAHVNGLGGDCQHQISWGQIGYFRACRENERASQPLAFNVGRKVYAPFALLVEAGLKVYPIVEWFQGLAQRCCELVGEMLHILNVVGGQRLRNEANYGRARHLAMRPRGYHDPMPFSAAYSSVIRSASAWSFTPAYNSSAMARPAAPPHPDGPTPTPEPTPTPQPTPTPSAPQPPPQAPERPHLSGPIHGHEPPAQWDTPPPLGIDPDGTYRASLATSDGVIGVELLPKLAPNAVNNFIFLAENGFYRRVPIHRMIPDFMFQSGDPTGTGTGGPGYDLPDDPMPPNARYSRGVLAMANTGQPNSGGSQFFVMLGDYPLPPTYTIFGRVISGDEVLTKIQQRKVVDNGMGEPSRPVDPIGIYDVTIER